MSKRKQPYEVEIPHPPPGPEQLPPTPRPESVQNTAPVDLEKVTSVGFHAGVTLQYRRYLKLQDSCTKIEKTAIGLQFTVDGKDYEVPYSSVAWMGYGV